MNGSRTDLQIRLKTSPFLPQQRREEPAPGSPGLGRSRSLLVLPSDLRTGPAPLARPQDAALCSGVSAGKHLPVIWKYHEQNSALPLVPVANCTLQ